jgi:hypothetical protein
MEMAVSFILLREYLSLESHVDATLRLRFIFNAIMTFIVAGAGYLMVRYTFLSAFIVSLHSANWFSISGSSFSWHNEHLLDVRGR